MKFHLILFLIRKLAYWCWFVQRKLMSLELLKATKLPSSFQRICIWDSANLPPHLSNNQPTKHPNGVVFHSLHKCASMFLFQLFFRLAKEKRIPFYSPNYERPTDHLLRPNVDHDFCYGPVRHFLLHTPELDAEVNTKRIFQIRDPRDILCSEYFSFGWNHTEKGFSEKAQKMREEIRNKTIDEYLLDEEGASYRLIGRLKPLLRYNFDANIDDVTLVSYEEMINDFGSWLAKVVKPFGFGPIRKPVVLAKYRFKYRREFRPDNSPNAHKRNVTPGEYLRRLRPDTIKVLNKRFEQYLTLFAEVKSGTSKSA